jgi:GNAT superfamily N-acetyltransferase
MVTIRTARSAGESEAREIWPVYDEVFGDQPDYETWYDAVWSRHRDREGFRLARAHEQDRLLGFAYGYTGNAGQWWTDRARQVLPPELGDAWLGGHFELVSIGVVDGARRAGIGRALLRDVLDGLPHERLLLMTTSEASDPARILYASEGWAVVGAGIGDATVIMGKRTAPGRAGSDGSAAGGDGSTAGSDGSTAGGDGSTGQR